VPLKLLLIQLLLRLMLLGYSLLKIGTYKVARLVFSFFKTFLGEAGPGDAVAHVVSRKEVLKTKFYILTPFSPIPGNLGQILT